MATIVIEDGSGVAGANSYVTEAELLAYAVDRDVTLSGTPSVLLIKAMDYLEQQNFKGEKNSNTQPLVWPRYGVWIDGFAIDSDTIPQLLKDAQIEAAISIDGSNDPLADIGREVKKQKLEGLEIEYMDGARQKTSNAKMDNKLRKLLKGGGSAGMVIRA